MELTLFDDPNNTISLECRVKIDPGHFLSEKQFISGNDYLYEFCQNYPFSDLIDSEVSDNNLIRQKDKELAFADQMWLIGRSYAASPQRYSYRTKPEKYIKKFEKGQAPKAARPNETFLDSEGYESFFQDIAFMLFREDCHNINNPCAYLRGEHYELKKKLEELEELNGIPEVLRPGSEDGQALLESAENACEKLRKFQSLKNKIAEGARSTNVSTKAKQYSLLGKSNELDLSEGFRKDTKIAIEMSMHVIEFAECLNAATKLRDIAIILRSVTNLQKCEDKLQDNEKNYREMD